MFVSRRITAEKMIGKDDTVVEKSDGARKETSATLVADGETTLDSELFQPFNNVLNKTDDDAEDVIAESVSRPNLVPTMGELLR